MKFVWDSEYTYYIVYGPIDRTYERNFYPAGNYVYVSVLENYCDGAKAGVGAYLNGMCTY